MSTIATTAMIKKGAEALKFILEERIKYGTRWARIARTPCPKCGSTMKLKNYRVYVVVPATKAECVSCGHTIYKTK